MILLLSKHVQILSFGRMHLGCGGNRNRRISLPFLLFFPLIFFVRYVMGSLRRSWFPGLNNFVGTHV